MDGVLRYVTEDKTLVATFGLSVAVQASVFYTSLARWPDMSQKQKSWILSALASAIMTLCSLPYLCHWVISRDVSTVFTRPAELSCTFFMSYLFCDLLLGSIHYRSLITMLTGWIHHIVYITLLSAVIIPRGFSPLFCLACILEFPTFLLAIGSLDARFRNDYLFATVFFLTRIVFHVHLAFSLGLKAHADTLSWIPSATLVAVFPMHVLWMRDCVAGILRRRARAAKLASSGLSTTDMPVTPLHAPVGSGFLGPTNVTPAVVTGIELQQEHRFRRETLERFRARVVNLRPQEVYMRLQDPHMRAHVATEGMAAVKRLRDRLRQRLRVRIP